jgi:cysteinyl-tRNA synthetase
MRTCAALALHLTFAALFLAAPIHALTLTTSDGPVTVNHWGYQLQGPPATGELDPAALAASAYDLIVTDYARFGDDASAFTQAQVAAIKNRTGSTGQRRVAAAYLSIGEAGDFRSFWNPAWTNNGSANSPLTAAAPAWLGPVNPDWPESRKVRYWDAGWQNLIFNNAHTGWLDTIVSQGFDAAYLDIVDAYYFWGEEATPAQKKPGDPADSQVAARRMIDFIVALTAHARLTNPHFFVIPQNGEFILNDSDYAGALNEDPVRRAAFLNAVGLIGVEDVFCFGDLDENNPFNPDSERIDILTADFLAAGKGVLAVDYVNEPALVTQFTAAAQNAGFISFAAPSRDLDVLPAIPEPTAAALLTPIALVLLHHRRHRHG